MEYIDAIRSKLDSNKNVFICYRGMYGRGGLVAQLLYHHILECKYRELIPFCAPLCNKLDDFQKQSYRAIGNCKIFVAIFTKDFFETYDVNDDQVRKEFIMLAKELLSRPDAIHILPVYVDMLKGERQKFDNDFNDWLFDESKSTLNCKIWKEFNFASNNTDKGMNAALAELKNKFKHCSNCAEVRFDLPVSEYLSRVIEAIYDKFHSRQKINDGVVWVGSRLSDIDHIRKNFFSGAITLFGINDEKHNLYAMCDEKTSRRVDHNKVDKVQDQYIYDQIKALLSKDPNSRFYFYNQSGVYNIAKLNELLGYNKICVNSQEILDKLSNKLTFHSEYSKIGNGKGILHVEKGGYAECDYGKLCEKFGVDESENIKFIVQAPVASGGNGTFILTKENAVKIKNSYLTEHDTYLYSIYRENNVPINIHAIIFDDGVLFTPGSIQVMRADFQRIDSSVEVRRLMYRGADFIEFNRLAHLEDNKENKVNKKHIESFKELCLELCEIIKEEGYRGVLGIDGMIYDDKVQLLEVNCRFQASTGLINRALEEKNAPSIQEINIAAWNRAFVADYQKYFDDLEVKYSNYSYNYIGEDAHTDLVLSRYKECPYVVGMEMDGYAPRGIKSRDYDNTAHLFRVVYKTNICWVNEDGAVNLDECVSEPVEEFRKIILSIPDKLKPVDQRTNNVVKIDKVSLLTLKIALLMQGVKITEAVAERQSEYGIRPATNDAVDIKFGNNFYNVVINAPLNNKFSAFTPFEITVGNDSKLLLTYYGKEIADVGLYSTDKLENNKTSNGFRYSDVAYLSTDRLRVHVTNQCIYKIDKKSTCKFCNIIPTCGEINIDAIAEVVRSHWEKRDETGLRHFLIGGQSPEQNERTIETVAQITQVIKNCTREPNGSTNAEVYAMILPCESGIQDLKDAGLNQLSFNIEIFDPVCAKKYMPGKGAIPREKYKKCLLNAKRVWKESCDTPIEKAMIKRQIRSMLIFGLESKKSFFEGMSWMIENEIQPIISLFRPLDNTPLKDCVAPSMIDVYKLYFKLEDMIGNHMSNRKIRDNVAFILGPDCKCCQNNTLSLPLELI